MEYVSYIITRVRFSAPDKAEAFVVQREVGKRIEETKNSVAGIAIQVRHAECFEEK